MEISYRGEVNGHYIVQSLHRVFVDKEEITEQYDGMPSDKFVFNDVKMRVKNGELP